MNRKCIFIDIIGSTPDENENTNKIDGYYQVTNGILIRDFVLKLLNMKNEQVKIFAYGNEQLYDQYIHTNNKCYHQFDLNDIFQMNAELPGFKFKYFDNFKDVLQTIDSLIENNKYKLVILFLDDHGSKGKFSNMAYFQLYQMFLKYPNKSFLVFNDSCFSGSFNKLVEIYNKIHELAIEKEFCFQLIFSYKNLCKSILKKEEIKDPIAEVFRLVKFYQNNKISNQNTFNKFLNFINSKDKTIESIKEIGFQSQKEINDFNIVYDSYESSANHNENLNDIFKEYIKSQDIFNIDKFTLINKLINKDLPEFINVINILQQNKEDISFNIPPSQNIEIIASTDDYNKCFSFPSIRTNGVTKVYPGSPAMGSFLKELFMKFDKNKISFENMQKEMCGNEKGKLLCYSVRAPQKSVHGNIIKEWAYLLPQHYKSIKNDDISLSFSEDAKRSIAVLRTISFIINKKFKKLSRNLSPEASSIRLNHINDPMADMVALACILKDNSDIDEILNISVNRNKLFKEKELFGLDLIFPIIEFAFYSTKDKMKMMAVIMNCLQKAIQKEVYKEIISMNENSDLEMPLTKFILKNEIAFFVNKTENTSINKESNNNDNENKKDSQNEKLMEMIREDKKLEIISEVENSIFALISPETTFYAYLVASSILDDINIDKIKQSDFISDTSEINKFYKIFLHEKNINSLKEIEFRKLAESCLFSQVKLSLNSLNSICDMNIKNDAIKIVIKGFQELNALFLVNFFVENINGQLKDKFIDKVINPIEEILTKRKISTFFIPTIIKLISKDEIINALYASLSDLQDNWYDNLIKILKEVINNKEYAIMNCQYVYIGNILQLAEKVISKQKDIHNKSEYDAEINKINERYKEEINLSIKKIIKLVEISVKRVRGNMSRMMNKEILKNRIKDCSNYFKSIELNKYDDKFHNYLYSAISEFADEANSYLKKETINENNINEGFDELESLKNTDDLYKRAAIEFKTISHMFQISDESLYESNKVFNPFEKKSFQVSVMFARTLNLTEISPISCLLDSYSTRIDPSKGNNPNIKEIMGLFGANICILSLKDELRKRSKVGAIKEPENKSKEENHYEQEYDSYYSSDDDFNDVLYRPTQIKNENESIKNINRLPEHIWYKDQISQGDIEDIQKNLKIGRSDWTYESWIVFVFCFNERMKDINISFNPNDNFENEYKYFNISEAINIIYTFYPLHRIYNFWKNEDKLQLFIGKNRKHSKEIFRAMIRGFDDTDRIVTPIHMFRETYEKRTPAILKHIFEY